MFAKRDSKPASPTLNELVLDPFIRAIFKGEDKPIELMIESGILGDIHRNLSIVKITESEPVFEMTEGALDGDHQGVLLRLSVKDRGLMQSRFITDVGVIWPNIDAEMRQHFVHRARQIFLSRIAAALANPASLILEDSVQFHAVSNRLHEAAPHQASTVLLSSPAAVPVKKSVRRFLPWAVGLSVAALLVYAVTGLLPNAQREPDPLAGLAPDLRQQIEAASLRGSNSPAPANVTEQTLKAMGLDPGKAAANAGCLGVQER
jgi:hypothetical protein